MKKGKRLSLKLFSMLLLASVVLGLSLASCSREPQPLRIVVRQGAEASGLKMVADEWSKTSGVKVEVVTLGRENYETNVLTDLKSGSSTYDVVFLPSTLVAEAAARRDISPVVGWSSENDPDLFGAVVIGGKVWALPTDVSSFYLFYRSDLLSNAPKTWDEVLNVADGRAALRASASVPFVMAGKAGEELPKLFYTFLWSYGGDILDGTNVVIDSPNAVKAAEMFARLLTAKLMPRDIATWDVGRIYDELERGNVASSAPQWNALFPLIRAGKSAVKNSIEVASLPGAVLSDGRVNSINFRHSWTLVQASRSKRTGAAANQFVLYATGERGARIYAAESNGYPPRRSILTDSGMRKMRPDFGLMLTCLENSKSEPATAEYSKMHQIMNEELSAMISGVKTPTLAMQAAAERLRKLDFSR